MLKSRRGLLAAGLAVAVVGALGVASTMNAGAEQVPGDQSAAKAPVADQADSTPDVSTPPATLPWGDKPQRVRRGKAGASSKELRAQGLQAAADDHSHHLDFAPKGKLSKTSFLRSQATDVKPPLPPVPPASPSASATSAAATTAPATTSAATTAPAATTAAATTAPATTAPATSSATTAPVQPLAATDTPTTGTSPVIPGGDDDSASFSYVDTYETTTADGMYAAMDIKKPALAQADYHTLAELAVQSGDVNHNQTIEVGWNVDREVNGDDQAHLFVFHWVNGKPSCYNTCGKFVNYTGGIAPGETLPADTLKKFGIQHSNNAWWIAYDTTWVGYFPDSEWTDQGAKFTQGGFFQAYGEVAAASSCPTGTQMGNGVAAGADASSTAARIANVSYLNGPATPNLTARVVGGGYNIAFFKDALGNVSTKSFRYGGTPMVVPDPDPDKAKQGGTVCAVTPAKQ